MVEAGGRNLVVWGAGGHAISLAETVRAAGGHIEAFFVDEGLENSPRLAPLIAGRLAIADWVTRRGAETLGYLVAIGMAGKTRREKATILDGLGLTAATIVDPRAIVAGSAVFGVGTQVMAGAQIGAFAAVGEHCIVNTGCCIEHECSIGSFVDLAPHAVVLGRARLGDNVLVGANATVLEGRAICNDVIVGAGAVVIDDIAEPGTYVGVPARRVSGRPRVG